MSPAGGSRGSGAGGSARRDPDEPAPWVRHYSHSSLGIEIVVATMLGLGAGMWMEKNVTHWAPWTTLIGLFFGLGAAAKAIHRTVVEVQSHNASTTSDVDAPDSLASEPSRRMSPEDDGDRRA